MALSRAPGAISPRSFQALLACGLRVLLLGVGMGLGAASVASAQTCAPYTYTLTNGTTADASQVMANFNTVRTCVNSLPTPTAPPPARGYIAGFTLSAAGSSATFGIAAGQATDSTNVASLALAAAYTKTTAAWVVGSAAGSLDTGTIANNTWYHVFLIQRTDTGVVDVLISTSATAPTLPAPYTLFRRIGSMKTDGSAQWKAFAQTDELFMWITPVADLVNQSISTSITNVTLPSVPSGVKVYATFNTYWQGGSSGGSVTSAAIFPPAVTGANIPYETGLANWIAGSTAGGATMTVLTDTAQHVSIIGAANSIQLWLNTTGWVDTRGKNN